MSDENYIAMQSQIGALTSRIVSLEQISGSTFSVSAELAGINQMLSEPIRVQVLHPNARKPKLGSELAAGYDVYSSEEVTLAPNEVVAVPLGFAAQLPVYVHARIESRSSMALRGLVVAAGVIDADYRGEWKAIIHNSTADSVTLAAGERVAQVVLRPTLHRSWEPADALEDTARGAGGFGSTGTR
jgi:dUTP pyrophosphatase